LRITATHDGAQIGHRVPGVEDGGNFSAKPLFCPQAALLM
jgi:hypothetical protein